MKYSLIKNPLTMKFFHNIEINRLNFILNCKSSKFSTVFLSNSNKSKLSTISILHSAYIKGLYKSSKMGISENIKKPSTCYYKVLNLSLNASQNEIKKEYFRLSKLYHPDTIDKSANNQLVSLILIIITMFI